MELSNTFLLEKEYNWKGILSEPSPGWKESLEKNRVCIKDYRCVYSESDKLVSFYQTREKEFSTISNLSMLINIKIKEKNLLNLKF